MREEFWRGGMVSCFYRPENSPSLWIGTYLSRESFIVVLSPFLFPVRDSCLFYYWSCLFSRWKIIETELRVRTVRCLICPEHVFHILAMLSVISLSFPVPVSHTSLVTPPVYLIRLLESLREIYSSNFRTSSNRGKSSTRIQRAIEGRVEKSAATSR